MAPLPQNNTARIFIDYTSNSVEHTMMLRQGTGSSPSEGLELAVQVAATLTTAMRTVDSVYGVRYSEDGSDFTLPLSWTPLNGTSGSSSIWAQDPESAFLGFTGRSSTTGRKVRYQFYTPLSFAAWPSDNRYDDGDSVDFDSFRDALYASLNPSGSPYLPAVCIDGTVPIMYNYVNIALNAYWQRKARRQA